MPLRIPTIGGFGNRDRVLAEAPEAWDAVMIPLIFTAQSLPSGASRVPFLVRCVCAALIAASIAALAGCDQGTGGPTHGADPSGAATSGGKWFGDESQLTFDFGRVVGGGGGELIHTFNIANVSSGPVTVTSVTNGKTCCGVVAADAPQKLAPGESMEVRVRLKPASFGPVQHWTSVASDADGQKEVILWTMADILPRAQITPRQEGSLRVRPGRSSSVAYDVYVFYSPQERLTYEEAFKKASIRVSDPSLAVSPSGPLKAVVEEAGVVRLQRSFSMSITGSDRPGLGRAEVLVRDEKGLISARQTVDWEVVADVNAAPSSLVFLGKRASSRTLVLASANGSAFRIVSIKADCAGIRGSSSAGERSARHVVTVSVTPGVLAGKTRKLGELTVSTDLPEQPAVRVPIYFVDQEASP